MDISEATRAELSNLLNCLSEKIGSTNGGTAVEQEAERQLQSMRDSLKRIAPYGSNDLFVCYLMERLEALAQVFAEAANKNVLRVTEHEFHADLLLKAFEETTRIFRYTWRIDPGARLFDDAVWQRHFALTSSMAVLGDLEVRSMIIVQDRAQCESENVKKLLEFFASHQNLDARIVLGADWESRMVDYAIPSRCLEFGIHGDKLVYQADRYVPVSAGSWSKDPITIERFTHFFDAVWNEHKIAANISLSAKEKVALSDLMAVDAAHDRRETNRVHETVALIEERMSA